MDYCYGSQSRDPSRSQTRLRKKHFLAMGCRSHRLEDASANALRHSSMDRFGIAKVWHFDVDTVLLEHGKHFVSV